MSLFLMSIVSRSCPQFQLLSVSRPLALQILNQGWYKKHLEPQAVGTETCPGPEWPRKAQELPLKGQFQFRMTNLSLVTFLLSTKQKQKGHIALTAKERTERQGANQKLF